MNNSLCGRQPKRRQETYASRCPGCAVNQLSDHVVENEKSAHCIYFHNDKSSLGDQKDLAKVNDSSLSM